MALSRDMFLSESMVNKISGDIQRHSVTMHVRVQNNENVIQHKT